MSIIVSGLSYAAINSLLEGATVTFETLGSRTVVSQDKSLEIELGELSERIISLFERYEVEEWPKGELNLLPIVSRKITQLYLDSDVESKKLEFSKRVYDAIVYGKIFCHPPWRERWDLFSSRIFKQIRD